MTDASIGYNTNKAKWKRTMKEKLSILIFLVPGIVFTIWLRYYPILNSLYVSLFRYDPVDKPGDFIGVENYINAIGTQFYWDAWANTFVFLGLNLLLVFFIPIIQAVFLNELTRFNKFFSTMYLITALIPISVNVILWKWIWHPEYGIANQIVLFFGGSAQGWLSDPTWTKFCIVFPGIIGGGVGVLMYLAAIKGIPDEIFECSRIDGASGFKRIWYVTLPNIRFLIMIQLVMTVINTMQILDAPYQYVSGGPSGASTTMGIYIYNTFRQDFNYGKASAASIILFAVVGIMTIGQMALDKSKAE